MEETNLRGVHSGGSGGDDDGDGGDDSNLGDGVDSVGFNNGHEFEDGSVGNDESEFSLELVSEDFELGFSLESELFEVFIVEVFFVKVFDSGVEDHSDQGVFSDDESGAQFIKISSDQLDLSGSDIF